MPQPQASDAAAPQHYELEFTLDTADMRAVLDHTWASDPAMREAWKAYHRGLRQWIWTATALTLGLMIFIGLRHEQIVDQGLGILPVLWGAVVAYFWWAIANMRAASKKPKLDATKERFIADRGTQYCLGPQRLSVSAEQLVLHTTHFDTVQRWTGIERIDAITTQLMLVRPDGRIFIVPARAFPSPAAFTAFTDDCRAWLAAHGAGDRQRIVRFLADIDFPCPKCSYNLRNCRAEQCPECGTPLDRGTVPNAF